MVTSYVQRPRDVIQTNKYVMHTSDVMFINNLLFIITFGGETRLIKAELMSTQMATQLQHNLKKIINLYSRGGFVIQTFLMDM